MQAAAAAQLATFNWYDAELNAHVEKFIADELGVPSSYVLVTGSCTAALYVAASISIRVSHGLIRVPVNTYPATYAGLLLEKLPVQFYDNAHGSIDDVEVAVELYGQPHRVGLRPQVLDAAHNVFGENHYQHIREGAAVCYSFGPQKEICSPGGGAIVSHLLAGDAVRNFAISLLHSGQAAGKRCASPHMVGVKGYMQAPSAAMILAQRDTWRESKDYRKELLVRYSEQLPAGYTKHDARLITHRSNSSGHLCVVEFKSLADTKKVQNALTRKGIEWSRHYDLTPFRDSFPRAHNIMQRRITLPCHWYVRPQTVEEICTLILETLHGKH